METQYLIIDIKTGETIARRNTLKAAHKYADKKDIEYGAVRYIVKRQEVQS